MRRLTWMAVGAAAGIGGRQWLSRRMRQGGAARRPAPVPGAGTPGPAPRPGVPADAVGGGGPADAVAGTLVGTVRLLADVAGPVADAAGTAVAAAGRTAARLVGMGARRAGERVRHAVDGGRADAREREAELRRELGRRHPSPLRAGPVGAAGTGRGRPAEPVGAAGSGPGIGPLGRRSRGR